MEKKERKVTKINYLNYLWFIISMDGKLQPEKKILFISSIIHGIIIDKERRISFFGVTVTALIMNY